MKSHALAMAMIACCLALTSCKRDATTPAYAQSVNVSADPASVESGGSTTVSAVVTEALAPKIGAKVNFVASGGCGTLKSTVADTRAGPANGSGPIGQAQVVFVGNSPYSTCQETVTATSQATGSTLIMVTPKKLEGAVAGGGLTASGTTPTVELVPDVAQDTSAGFSATYSVTSSEEIKSIRFVTTRKATFASSNNATVAPDSNNPNVVDITEPDPGSFSADVITLKSDSRQVGSLTATVTLKTSGAPLTVTFHSRIPGPK